jgi:hypothetical protein
MDEPQIISDEQLERMKRAIFKTVREVAADEGIEVNNFFLQAFANMMAVNMTHPSADYCAQLINNALSFRGSDWRVTYHKEAIERQKKIDSRAGALIALISRGWPGDHPVQSEMFSLLMQIYKQSGMDDEALSDLPSQKWAVAMTLIATTSDAAAAMTYEQRDTFSMAARAFGDAYCPGFGEQVMEWLQKKALERAPIGTKN